MSLPAPYFQDEAVTIYHGDCREIVPQLSADVLVTDPPYPNNAGHFDADVPTARQIIKEFQPRYAALIFWNELETPPCGLAHVATHIWHRTNVNGRPYEAIYHFTSAGIKRRSSVFQHPAVFAGAGPGCHEYLGHPTQKPVALMQALLALTIGDILDPFSGVGGTLRAAKNLRRKAIGIERDERFCEIASRRLSQQVLALT